MSRHTRRRGASLLSLCAQVPNSAYASSVSWRVLISESQTDLDALLGVAVAPDCTGLGRFPAQKCRCRLKGQVRFLALHIPRLHVKLISSVARRLSMNLLSLDLDVVHVILSEIQPPDALNLSLTCRAAHTVAYPRFLSEVVLGHPWRRIGPDRLLRFCTSMLADASLRVLYLRELTIHKTAFQPKRAASSHGLIDSSAMAFLAEVLKYAVNLRRICIHDTEELLETNPEFRWTLASLPSLQDIRFLNAGLRSIDVLVSTSSRPRRLELDLSGLPADMEAPRSYSAATLEHLMRDVIDVKLSRVTGAMLTIVTDYTWPKVSQLEIFGDLQSLAPFASVYPGLHRLSLVCSYVDNVSVPVRWEHLDHLSTSCPIPLEGNVRRMELIYDLDTLLDSMPYSVWAPGTMSLLQKTMPVVLACSPNMQILRWIANVVTSVRVLQVYACQSIHPDVAGVEDVETWLVSSV